jgi:hypothetical protein
MQYVTIDIPYVTLSHTVTEDHAIEKHIMTPFGSMDISMTNPEPDGKHALSESVIRVETELLTASYANSLALKGFAETIFALSYEVARKALRVAFSSNCRIELSLFGPQRSVHVWRQSDSHPWEFKGEELPSSD